MEEMYNTIQGAWPLVSTKQGLIQYFQRRGGGAVQDIRAVGKISEEKKMKDGSVLGGGGPPQASVPPGSATAKLKLNCVPV